MTSDASQIAAIEAAMRCIRTGERPPAAQRELLVEQLEDVRQRVIRAAHAKREGEARQ